MTIRDLLTHTAGITYPWMEYGPVEELYRRHVSHLSDQPLADLVQQLTAMPLAFQPGSRFRYGLCHDVAARLIEVISGMPLDRFLQERIFGPLEMVDTGFFVPPAEQHRLAAMIGARDPADVTASRSLKLAAAAGSTGSPTQKPTWSIAPTARSAAATGWCRPPPTTCASAPCCSIAGRSTARASSAGRPWNS